MNSDLETLTVHVCIHKHTFKHMHLHTDTYKHMHKHKHIQLCEMLGSESHELLLLRLHDECMMVS